MIARLTGTLVETDPATNTAYVDAGGGLIYETILPAYAAIRLAPREGQTVTLHTLCFFEATAQGATIFPRLAGFPSRSDQRFFELFVTVKGIGHRRALRAMVLDPGTLAAAIADRDLKLLQTMPEVGKKLAETLVVTLKDKVDKFVSAAAYDTPPTPGKKTTPAAPDKLTSSGGGTLAKDALEILLQLGEQRLDAVQLIDRVLARDDAPRDPQAVIEAVYALKAST
ncbi:MAG: Holliday junction branch migration protein RuvA [Planctomycetota bacterium]